MKILLFLALAVCVDAHGKLWLPKVYYVKSNNPYIFAPGYKHGLKYSSTYPMSLERYGGKIGEIGSSPFDFGTESLTAEQLSGLQLPLESGSTLTPGLLGSIESESSLSLGNQFGPGFVLPFDPPLGAIEPLSTEVPRSTGSAGIEIESGAENAVSLAAENAAAAKVAAESAASISQENTVSSLASTEPLIQESTSVNSIAPATIGGSGVVGSGVVGSGIVGSGIVGSGAHISKFNHGHYYHHFGRSHGYHYLPGTKRSYILNRYYRVEPKFYQHHGEFPYKFKGFY